METYLAIAPILLWLVVPVVTGLLAMRKGYNFFLWLLAAGIIGLVILAFLPFANGATTSPEEHARLRKTGNAIGGSLAAIALLFGLLRLLGSA